MPQLLLPSAPNLLHVPEGGVVVDEDGGAVGSVHCAAVVCQCQRPQLALVFGPGVVDEGDEEEAVAHHVQLLCIVAHLMSRRVMHEARQAFALQPKLHHLCRLQPAGRPPRRVPHADDHLSRGPAALPPCESVDQRRCPPCTRRHTTQLPKHPECFLAHFNAVGGEGVEAVAGGVVVVFIARLAPLLVTLPTQLSAFVLLLLALLFFFLLLLLLLVHLLVDRKAQPDCRHQQAERQDGGDDAEDEPDGQAHIVSVLVPFVRRRRRCRRRCRFR
mmetsp:Transcript_2359/g.4718  ORF Transcript_2359/g.4718 Transcript_2359/m.4718 type:complete len:273 (+) Transcript_2359:533-1351(+)